ncbi:coniferyl aldehyde dehydrogenase [Massilia sp. W12]|uniref:coniferyl aldehyde dehydrogenase n=1 Tax=Massilia sp. W12 TaxID=3126507 RepID=UPI0030D1C79A
MDSVLKFPTTAQAPLQELKNLFAAQQQAFQAEMIPSKAVRKDRLRRVELMTRKYADELAQTISADFGNRAPQLTMLADTMLVEAAARHAIKHLSSWMRTRRAPTALYFQPGSNRIMRQPLGVVGVIAPWNYPYQLALAPAVGALAAGNRVLIKPSELTPRFAALLQKMVAEFFRSDEMAVVTGDAEVGRAFSELPFDHLLFTGSTQVGRLVAQAAARNLTPVTLELGGKSPVLVHSSAEIEETAARVAHGKLFNAGQTCVAPDYVFVPKDKLQEFIDAFKRATVRMFPRIANNPDYTSIISERHYQRLRSLLDDAHAHGAQVIEINPEHETLDPAARMLAPTLVLGATDEMRILQEEIFGPLLPVLTYDKLEQALDYINRHERPLALYFMGSDMRARDHVLSNTIAGGVTVNDCIWHFGQEDVPTGGVGPSGMGAYHGEYGFLTFSKQKPVFQQPWLNGMFLLRPPYGPRFAMLSKVLKKLI